jgi:hypothetical protein
MVTRLDRKIPRRAIPRPRVQIAARGAQARVPEGGLHEVRRCSAIERMQGPANELPNGQPLALIGRLSSTSPEPIGRMPGDSYNYQIRSMRHYRYGAAQMETGSPL